MRDSEQDARVTELLRQRDRIDAELGELGVHLAPRTMTMAEWDSAPVTADDQLPALGDV